MTEKTIFFFFFLKEKDAVKYEIRQGEDLYTCYGIKTPRCRPSVFSSHIRKVSRLHRKFMRLSKKRMGESLNTLEKMYDEFYGSERAVSESNKQ